jgi:hypothetical protein
VFDKALNELLQHPDWELWSEQLLPRYYYPPRDVAHLKEKHGKWYQEVQERRATERAVAAAEAAAAEVADVPVAGAKGGAGVVGDHPAAAAAIEAGEGVQK